MTTIFVAAAILRNYGHLISLVIEADRVEVHMANIPGRLAAAANSAGVADVSEETPSDASLAALDAIAFFLAASLSGFGAYVASFLADQNWTAQNIGFVLTAAWLAGLLSQTPAGELLDTIHSKRFAVILAAAMIAAVALVMALWPSFFPVLTALVIEAITGGFLGLALASVSLGLVGHDALGERLGRNQRFAAAGGVFAAGFMGLVSYFLSYRAIFLVAAGLGHRLIRSQPDTERCQFNRGEEVVVPLVIPGGDGAEVLEFVEEPFDSIALAVEPSRKGRPVFPVWHQADIAPGAAFGEAIAQGVAIIGAIRQEDVPGLNGSEHIGGFASIVSLPLAQFQGNWQAIGIDKRVDLRRQAAARAAHATGSLCFFWPLAAC